MNDREAVLAATALIERCDFPSELAKVGQQISQNPEVSELAKKLLRDVYQRHMKLCHDVMKLCGVEDKGVTPYVRSLATAVSVPMRHSGSGAT